MREPWHAAYIAALVLFLVNLLIGHSLRGYNSDDVAVQTVLGQWRRGFHATAHLGADSFILKVPLYLVVDWIVDNGRTALLVTTLILNLTGFVLFMVSVRYFATRFAVERPLLVVWPLLWVAGIGLIVTNALITPNLRNVEIGLAFFLAMLVAKCWDGELTPGWAWIVVAVPMVGLFVYDDPYFLFVWIVPVIALLLASAVVRAFDRRAALLAAVLLAGVVAYRVIHVAFASVGIRTAKAETSFATWEQVRHHLWILGRGGLQLFEADLINHPLSITQPRSALNLAVLLCTLLYPVALWRRRVGFREEPWKWFFGVQPVLVAGVFVVSDQAQDLASARYLILIPFLLVLVLGVGFQELPGKLRTAAAALVIAATAANVITTVDYYRTEPKEPNRLNFLVLDAAFQRGLTKGYAEYWNGNINTYLSKDRVDFIQVKCAESKLTPYLWLTDDGILSKPAGRTFYLWESDNPGFTCPYEELIAQFGEPAEVVPVIGDTKLLIYDYDLLQRM